jgi:hypothetical protein
MYQYQFLGFCHVVVQFELEIQGVTEVAQIRKQLKFRAATAIVCVYGS